MAKKLEKLMRDFLWNDNKGKKKVHLVKWPTLYRRKKFGGLRIKNLKKMNSALLAKTKNKSVAETYVEDTASWNLSVPRRLNVDARGELADLQRSLTSVTINKEMEDVIQWSIGPKGQFSVKSTYDSLKKMPEHGGQVQIFSYIWKQKFPPKVKFFLCTIAHNSLSTRDMLLRRGMDVSKRCLFYDKDETVNHLFLHCKFASKIWDHFKEKLKLHFTMPDDFFPFLFSWNIVIPSNKQFQIWCMVSVDIVWSIWLERNSRVFTEKMNYEITVQQKIKHLLFTWCSVFQNLENPTFQDFMTSWPRIYFDYL
ncbi:uncharacterized protein LOC113360020 [Papaver somniferum]|uniref:uncharacterized protein LOC113360020 n=1 Tax=Papaver somniferum TaxID=3469 RepID=UPI000E700335|nr:uncharacterized protein LOC113360020 [Papaver somniferum]